MGYFDAIAGTAMDAYGNILGRLQGRGQTIDRRPRGRTIDDDATFIAGAPAAPGRARHIENPYVTGEAVVGGEGDTAEAAIAREFARHGGDGRALFAATGNEEYDPAAREQSRRLTETQNAVLARLATGDNPDDAAMARFLLGIPAGQSVDASTFDDLSRSIDGLLGKPMTPEGHADQFGQLIDGLPERMQRGYADAADAHMDVVSRRMAADRIAISEQMGAPGVTQADIEDLQAQFQRKYAGFTELPPTPINREQAAKLKQKMELADAEAKDGIPRAFNRFGQMVADPAWETKQRLDFDRLKSLREAAIKDYDREVDYINSLPGKEPGPDASPEQIEAYEQRVRMADDMRFRAFQRMRAATQAGAEPVQPPAPRQPAAPSNRGEVLAVAQQQGLPLVSDQDDFDALPSGTRFVDSADGQTYRKD